MALKRTDNPPDTRAKPYALNLSALDPGTVTKGDDDHDPGEAYSTLAVINAILWVLFALAVAAFVRWVLRLPP